MREIKFRGRQLSTGKWIYGDLVHDNIGGFYVYPMNCNGLFRDNRVAAETVGQFTGLNDKNGKEIYEGDIVRIYDCVSGDHSDEVVEFAHGVFGVENWTKKILTTLSFFMTGCDFEYSVEVIGNVYQNKELLENG